MRSKSIIVLVMLLVITQAITSQASLIDRGGGLIYDEDNDITWLQDARYAMTSGYDDDGLLTWNDAKIWAENLVYYDQVRETSWNNWRLPHKDPSPGYGSEQTNGEIGHLYHSDGITLLTPGDYMNLPPYDSHEIVSFWLLEDDGVGQGWDFSFLNGGEYLTPKSAGLYAWAVHDGDVPEPGTLLLIGLGSMALLKKRRA